MKFSRTPADISLPSVFEMANTYPSTPNTCVNKCANSRKNS